MYPWDMDGVRYWHLVTRINTTFSLIYKAVKPVGKRMMTTICVIFPSLMVLDIDTWWQGWIQHFPQYTKLWNLLESVWLQYAWSFARHTVDVNAFLMKLSNTFCGWWVWWVHNIVLWWKIYFITDRWTGNSLMLFMVLTTAKVNR